MQLIARSKQSDASDELRNELFDTFLTLEEANPTQEPASSILLGGKWSLLYTGASEEDVATRRRKEGVIGSTVTELMGASSSDATVGKIKNDVKPLGRSISNLEGTAIENKGNFQDIDVSNGLVENRAEFVIFGQPASVRIEGRCEPVAEEEHKKTRLAVYFERVQLRFSALSVVLPLQWANGGKGPEGWVDTTYLDSDFRCGRGDKGSFFIAARRPE